ncbi:MAG: radical SAM family heme chaperone HemW [Bacteroidetes bacterium]|nr:MAG: radical SAM family heme chaperone HemW [Bacteroidota bacterium]
MAGIYIHIPFCKKKCSYCDFHFTTSFHAYKDRMMNAIEKEISDRKREIQTPLETIYFGGGTPSLLSTTELASVLSAIRASFEIKEDAEVTLETNPDDLRDVEVIRSWRNAGVNRLSIGIQSFRQKDLDWMNRAHDISDIFLALKNAKEVGIDNITIDLIYGLPEMDLSEWEEQLDQFLELEIPHLSAYCLTVEPRTALNKWVETNEVKPANDDLQSEQFNLLVSKLAERGYEQYEISNFAIKGFRSRHNSAYWEGKEYLGIGPSAHSFDGKVRRWNVANNHIYMKGLEENEVYFEEEHLTEKERFNEYLLTGLRKIEGISLKHAEEILQPDNTFYKTLEKFVDMKWVDFDRKNDQITLTMEGKLRADHIASSLFFV